MNAIEAIDIIKKDINNDKLWILKALSLIRLAGHNGIDDAKVMEQLKELAQERE